MKEKIVNELKKIDRSQIIPLGSVGFIFVVLILGVLILLLTNDDKRVPTSTLNAQAEEELSSSEDRVYNTHTMTKLDSIAWKGQASLQQDNAYYYESEKGTIESVMVQDGQHVRQGDVLFKYRSDNPQTQYDLEDAQRNQARLREDRERVINELQALTGGAYNHRGDRLVYYWDEQGNEHYYVADPIGPSGKGGTIQQPSSTSSDFLDTNSGEGESETGAETSSPTSEEGLKQSIRDLNRQIEDDEIKIERLMAQKDGLVTAKRAGKVVLDQEGMDNERVPLVRVISQTVSITGQVGEYDYHLLNKDQPVNVYVNAEDRDVKGKIINFDELPTAQIPSTGDLTNRVNSTSTEPKYGFEIEAEEFIQPGFTVQVSYQPEGMSIPSQAIVYEGKIPCVYLYQDGKAILQQIKLKSYGTSEVVIDGLKPSDQVILEPAGLETGQEVKVSGGDASQEEKKGLFDFIK